MESPYIIRYCENVILYVDANQIFRVSGYTGRNENYETMIDLIAQHAGTPHCIAIGYSEELMTCMLLTSDPVKNETSVIVISALFKFIVNYTNITNLYITGKTIIFHTNTNVVKFTASQLYDPDTDVCVVDRNEYPIELHPNFECITIPDVVNINLIIYYQLFRTLNDELILFENDRIKLIDPEYSNSDFVKSIDHIYSFKYAIILQVGTQLYSIQKICPKDIITFNKLIPKVYHTVLQYDYIGNNYLLLFENGELWYNDIKMEFPCLFACLSSSDFCNTHLITLGYDNVITMHCRHTNKTIKYTYSFAMHPKLTKFFIDFKYIYLYTEESTIIIEPSFLNLSVWSEDNREFVRTTIAPIPIYHKIEGSYI